MIVEWAVGDMNKTGKIILIAVSGSVLLACGLYFGSMLFLHNLFYTNDLDNQNPQKQDEMLSITMEWARLAPLPDSKSQFIIQKEGSAFTRSFRASFYLSKADLDAWVRASPGLQDAEVETISSSTSKYVIQPGGGAMYAEAVIDFGKCYVETYVYWS